MLQLPPPSPRPLRLREHVPDAPLGLLVRSLRATGQEPDGGAYRVRQWVFEDRGSFQLLETFRTPAARRSRSTPSRGHQQPVPRTAGPGLRAAVKDGGIAWRIIVTVCYRNLTSSVFTPSPIARSIGTCGCTRLGRRCGPAIASSTLPRGPMIPSRRS